MGRSVFRNLESGLQPSRSKSSPTWGFASGYDEAAPLALNRFGVLGSWVEPEMGWVAKLQLFFANRVYYTGEWLGSPFEGVVPGPLVPERIFN